MFSQYNSFSNLIESNSHNNNMNTKPPRARADSANSVGSSNSIIITSSNNHQRLHSFDNNSDNNSDGSVVFHNSHNNVDVSKLPYPQRRLYWSQHSHATASSQNSNLSPPKQRITSRNQIPRSNNGPNSHHNHHPHHHPPKPQNRSDSMDKNTSANFNLIPRHPSPISSFDDNHNHYIHNRTGSSGSTTSRQKKLRQEFSNKRASGNSAVLGTLSKQLAKDVAHFFRREKESADSSADHQRNPSRASSNGSIFVNTPGIQQQQHHHTHSSSGEGSLFQNVFHKRIISSPNQTPNYLSPNGYSMSSSPKHGHVKGFSHHRLPSIENDDWSLHIDEADTIIPNSDMKKNIKKHSVKPFQQNEIDTRATMKVANTRSSKNNNHQSSASAKRKSNKNIFEYVRDQVNLSSDEDEYDNNNNLSHYHNELYHVDANERTRLLPPSGISTQERNNDSKYHRGYTTSTTTTTNSDSLHSPRSPHSPSSEKKKHKKRKNKLYKKKLQQKYDYLSSSSSSSSANDSYFQQKLNRKLQKEKQRLMKQWKAEAQMQQQQQKQQSFPFIWFRQIQGFFAMMFHSLSEKCSKYCILGERFLSNLPLTMGAIAYSFASLSTVWFKFSEEMMETCVPVHYHSNQCSFPEYPGCFYCDTTVFWYKVALNMHYTFVALGGIFAMSVVLKCIVAPRIVIDEMSSPITAAPAGMTCICLAVVFAGKGLIGKYIVVLAASSHFLILLWFLYMSMAYHILPEPSWFPNTTAIGICAVKMWLYYPYAGHFLMAICTCLCLIFLPISIVRTFLSGDTISAPVCWMQMAAPSQALYALTLMAQPSFEEEYPDVTQFQAIHRIIYLPFMHFFFFLSVLAALSSFHSIIRRNQNLWEKPFSPAHAAFCCPHLTHANAIQAYRSALIAFSTLKDDQFVMRSIFIYWMILLCIGSVTTVYVATKYCVSLKAWTFPYFEDEIEPPAPNETYISEFIATAGDEMTQRFVSPAVLQANETGLLLRLNGDEYRRTRRIPAIGFTPTMNYSEMEHERELLLDHVVKHPPKQRKRTLSVPGIDFNYGGGQRGATNAFDFGHGNAGVYDAGRVLSRGRAGTIDVIRRV